MMDFLRMENEDLIKVILIKGILNTVSETKDKVYQKYKRHILLTKIHLQHVLEEYDEIAKLSARQKILSFTQHVESIRTSIPLYEIGTIVKKAVDRALSEENITRLCFDAVLQESGNTRSDPYLCRSFATVRRLKRELVEKTLDSVSQCLGSEISSELQRYILADIKRKFNLDINPFLGVFSLPALILLQTILTVLTGFINPYAGAFVAVVSVVGTFVIAVNVNSPSWRRNVASEIHENVIQKKETVVGKVTSNICERCLLTISDLNSIADQLDSFLHQMGYNDELHVSTFSMLNVEEN